MDRLFDIYLIQIKKRIIFAILDQGVLISVYWIILHQQKITMETETLNNSIDNCQENSRSQLDHLHLEFNNLRMAKLSIPSGSQEFQQALVESGVEPEETGFRKRSHTVDSSYTRPKNHVHFSMKLTTTEPCKHGSSEDIHKRHGILRHHEGGRGRSNTLDYPSISEKEDVKATKETTEKAKQAENGKPHKNQENHKKSEAQEHTSGFRSIFRSRPKSESSVKKDSKSSSRKKESK